MLGEDALAVATSLNNLALLYESQGKYAEAERLFQRSLVIKEKVLGENHLAATSLNNLAGLYRAQDNYAKAEALYLKAISILEKAFPEGHPNLDLYRKNLAVLRGKM